MILFRIIWNEIKKEFFNTLSYKWQWLGEFTTLIAFFCFLNMLSQNNDAGIAYCMWFYSVILIGDVSGKISLEMRTGTFEQIYLSSISIPILFFSKAIAAILRALFVMSCLVMIFWLFGHVNFSFFNYKLIYILIVTTPGLFGISLFMGGVTILLKDISWLMNILNNTFLFLSGIFLPLVSFSDKIQKIALMFPLSQAVKALNQNQFYINDCVEMIIINFLYLILGIFCFFICERKAKMKGILGHY